MLSECSINFTLVIHIANNRFEKLIGLLSQGLHLLYQMFFTFLSQKIDSQVCIHTVWSALCFYTLSLDKSRRFWLAPLLSLLLAFTVPRFFLPFFPSRATTRQSANHFLDLQSVLQWENSYSGFWFYASLLRPPRKHHGILKKKPQNNSFLLARTWSNLCL